MIKTRHSLGFVAVMMLGATVACSGDDGDPPIDAVDTGTPTSETGTIDTGEVPDTTELPDTTTPDSVVAMDADAAAPTPTLDFQIINVSDWHGQIDPLEATESSTDITRQYGGLAVLSTYFKEERAKLPTLTATSGDVTGATPPISTRGTALIDEPAILSMNFLGLQVDTLGNHNFDRSLAAYALLLDKSNYVTVSSNLTNLDNTEMTCGVLGMATGPCGMPGKKPDGSARIVKPYHILSIGAGADTVKVAFIGLTNTDAPRLLFPGLMGKITVENPTVKANEIAALARKDGAQVVVVLYHQGATGFDPVAMKPTGPLIDDVAGMKPELIDLVLGDHSNQLVNTTIGGIKVIENLSAGRTYARTTIKVTKGVVTSVTPESVTPLGRETTKSDVLLGSDMKPIACSAATPCPSGATPAWACTSGTCRRSHKCNLASGGTSCLAGWACSADGSTCTNVVKAPDPAALTLIKPWADKQAAEYDVLIGKTTLKMERGPTCPTSGGCPPTPLVNLERVYQQPIGDLIADALLTRLAFLGAKIGIQNGGGIRNSIPSNYAPRRISAVTSAGTAPPEVTVGGTPTINGDFRIEVTTAGTLGTMKFRWSSDGGATWTSDVTSAASVTLGSTGVAVTFSAATYATGNTYSFATKSYVRTGCSVATPCDVFLGDIYAVLPFVNKSAIRPVTAQTLWQALENSVGTKPAADGRFLQIAGFKFSFSLTAPVGARVKNITLADGTVLMDTTAATPIVADAGKTCTTDADCSGGYFGAGNFTCVADVDKSKKCMIKVATNDFVSAGGETAPFKPGALLGTSYNDMAEDVIAYVKDKMLLTPGPTNFSPPSASASTTRIIELP